MQKACISSPSMGFLGKGWGESHSCFCYQKHLPVDTAAGASFWGLRAECSTPLRASQRALLSPSTYSPSFPSPLLSQLLWSQGLVPPHQCVADATPTLGHWNLRVSSDIAWAIGFLWWATSRDQSVLLQVIWYHSLNF